LITGWLYPPGSSARHSAELSAVGFRFIVSADSGNSISGNIDELEISHRIGNIPRRIIFPDQSLFETEDNEGVDQLIREFGSGSHISGVLHHLETHWRWIGVAFIATLVIGFSTVYWGMPWASKKIAFSLSPSVLEIVSEQTLVAMDRGILEPSELPQEEQQRLREHFNKKLLPTLNGEFSYQLHFRHMGGIANAFALPSGAIIITDRLIALADDQNQIDAVLFHEIGHVVHRHGMQRILLSSFMTTAIILVTGDVSMIENMAVALPVFLLKSHYSRKDESQADRYAFESMIHAGVDPIHFGRIMEKLGDVDEQVDDQPKPSDKTTSDEDKQNKKNTMFEYISTHPSTLERIHQANEYSELFNKKQLNSSESALPPKSPVR
jgi:Zn-dependent protease with chaperone function